MRARSVVLTALVAIALPGAARSPAPSNPYHLKPGAEGRLCLECHVTFQDTLKLPSVHTPVRSGRCIDCHSPHASSHGKFLSGDTSTICSTCHAGLVPDKARSVHPPVGSGQCIRCHDPHAAKYPKNLRFPGNEICSGCHADLTQRIAQAAFKHRPVETSCLTCHDPHGSARAGALLKKEVPALCTDCHRADQPAFIQRHMNYPVAKARCTSCHDPHGSKNGGLLWASVHPPILNKMCAQCHMDARSPNALAVKKQGSELCRGCHSNLLNEIAAKDRIHWPVLDRAACLNCHGPHATEQPSLLRKPAKTLCGSCHTDTVERIARATGRHKPVDEGLCTTCHSPHASDRVFLIRANDEVALCGTCHNWQQHSSHPIGDKVLDPRNKNLTLTCSSCHRAHGSAFKAFAHADPGADLCVQCHQDVRR